MATSSPVLASSWLDPVALTPAMADVLYLAHVFAPAATPIVLYGESGTGKTYLAEYIHRLSGRASGFHSFSVGTVAPQLALDELFGHVPGAYTDARKPRPGRIAAAETGTLLLDDMQTLDAGVQKQLLQVLDRGTYSPVGSDRVMTVACRVILAMTEDPEDLMRRGQMLKDLRYRFGVCAIRVPTLAERRAEIPSLAQRFLHDCPSVTGVDGPTRFTTRALDGLTAGEYPGNVRELQGVVVWAYMMARAANVAEVGAEHLPETLSPPLRYKRWGDREANRRAVERALARTGGNVTEAARVLGVSRNTVDALSKASRALNS
jgi:sigma-54 dependent transcriptional regulator, acetoin dehydrogenase operon transcriptional activator AcoR